MISTVLHEPTPHCSRVVPQVTPDTKRGRTRAQIAPLMQRRHRDTQKLRRLLDRPQAVTRRQLRLRSVQRRWVRTKTPHDQTSFHLELANLGMSGVLTLRRDGAACAVRVKPVPLRRSTASRLDPRHYGRSWPAMGRTPRCGLDRAGRGSRGVSGGVLVEVADASEGPLGDDHCRLVGVGVVVARQLTYSGVAVESRWSLSPNATCAPQGAESDRVAAGLGNRVPAIPKRCQASCEPAVAVPGRSQPAARPWRSAAPHAGMRRPRRRAWRRRCGWAVRSPRWSSSGTWPGRRRPSPGAPVATSSGRSNKPGWPGPSLVLVFRCPVGCGPLATAGPAYGRGERHRRKSAPNVYL